MYGGFPYAAVYYGQTDYPISTLTATGTAVGVSSVSGDQSRTTFATGESVGTSAVSGDAYKIIYGLQAAGIGTSALSGEVSLIAAAYGTASGVSILSGVILLGDFLDVPAEDSGILGVYDVTTTGVIVPEYDSNGGVLTPVDPTETTSWPTP